MASFFPPLPPEELERFSREVGTEIGADPRILRAIAERESGGSPVAIGDGGRALGMMQMHEAAAKDVGWDRSNWTDPKEAMRFGGKYYQKMLDAFGGDPELALQAYNAGPGRVRSGSVPEGARRYSDAVLRAAGAGREALGAPKVPGYSPADVEEVMRPPISLGERPPYTGPGTPAPVSAEGEARAEDEAPSLPLGARDYSSASPTPGPTGPGGPTMWPDREYALSGEEGQKKGGGFSGFLSKVGKGLKTVLPYLLGGSAYMAYKLSSGHRREEDERATRMENWKAEREQKTKWENAQVEAAGKVMDELQGLNLTRLIEAEQDPQKRALLQQAAGRIQEIGKKYAEMMAPGSEGGAMITPKEAGEILQMRSMFRGELDNVLGAKDEFGAREKGRLEGVTSEARIKELERQAAGGSEFARGQLDKEKAGLTTIEMDIGGGQKAPMTIQDAATFQRGQYYANMDRMKKDPSGQMAQAWLSKNAMIISALKMDQAEAVLKGDRKRLAIATAQLEELERAGMEVAGGKYTPGGGQGSPAALPQGYTMGWEDQ